MVYRVITQEALISTKDFGLVWQMHVHKASSETSAPWKSSGNAAADNKTPLCLSWNRLLSNKSAVEAPLDLFGGGGWGGGGVTVS